MQKELFDENLLFKWAEDRKSGHGCQGVLAFFRAYDGEAGVREVWARLGIRPRRASRSGLA
jgi:hypothetical protein